MFYNDILSNYIEANYDTIKTLLKKEWFKMKHKNFFQRMTMPLSDLEQYHRQQRKMRFESGDRPKNIKLREMCYPIFHALIPIF